MNELHHCVYVIALDAAVRDDAKFAEANPGCRRDAPCVYVGMTGLSPEERFVRHKSGVQSSRVVRKHGVRLEPELYEHLNPMSFPDAAKMEVELAEDLRRRGYAVWQR
jgi:hypothetical protein